MGRKSRLGIAAVVVAAAVLSILAGSGRESVALAGPTNDAAAARHVSAPQSVPKLTTQGRVLLARSMATSIAAGSATRFVCYPAAGTPTNTSTVQSCTVLGSQGVCIERSTNPAVAQSCTFTQTNASGSNVAIAVQVIEQRNPVQTGVQSGTQSVESHQGNVSGSNFTWSTQIIKQFRGPGSNNPDGEESQQQKQEAQAEARGAPADFGAFIQSLASTEISQENATPTSLAPATTQPVSQQQMSQQSISVCQGSTTDCTSNVGMTGNNINGNYQSLRQWEFANNAPSIDQEQNPAVGTCQDSSSASLNMCSVVSQNTTGGKNLSGVWENYRQFQKALHTAAGTQIQDPSFDQGGLGHDILQASDGLGVLTGPQRDWIVTGQRARQTQLANDTGALTQAQDPHVDKGPASMQTGSNADTWNGTLRADQLQLNNGLPASVGTQQQVLTYEGQSTGEIVASVRGTQNGSSASADCLPANGSPDFCQVGVECFGGSEGGGCVPITFGGGLLVRRP